MLGRGGVLRLGRLCTGESMVHRTAALLLLLAASTAAAQTLPSPSPRAIDQTLYVPAATAAAADGADATLTNPAGLSGAAGLQLDYLHQRSSLNDRLGDGLYLADTFDGFALGFSLEWVRFGADRPSFRRTTYALSLGDASLSVGGAFHLYGGSSSPFYDHLSSFDVGITTRPFRFLSAGFSALDVDAPRSARISVPRRYDFALALRPFHEWATVSADLLVSDRDGFDHAALAYNAHLRLREGLTLLGGVTHYFNEGRYAVTLGLQVDSAHVGLGYAAGSNSGLDQFDHTFGARLSSERLPEVHLGARFALLDLGELLSAPPTTALSLVGIGGSGADPYLSLLALLRRAKDDRGVQGLVLRFGGVQDGLGSGHVEELRQEIATLRAAGKPVLALLTDADDSDLFLASACDKIYAVPEATLLINGLSTDVVFLGEALSRLGVRVEVARVGAFKNAPDQLTRSDMSTEQREALTAFMTTAYGRYLEAVIAGRKLDKAKVEAALQKGILTPQEALSLGLIDGVGYPDELSALATTALGRNATTFTGYEDWESAPDRWGSLPRIALIRVQGDIMEGKSVGGGFGPAVAGAETIVKGIDAAREDDAVKAIVVRVDSPGGSGNASNLIFRALEKARAKKPVVVSMGNTAASGGYYVAIGGDAIWAEPTTLTGSIGVFVIKPDVSGLFEKLSIHDVTVKQGERADIFGLTKHWNEGEQAAMQGYVDAFYDRFITLVAERRKLTKPQVDAVARGRIWSGTDAKARGLVDQLGSLQDAIADAKKRAGLDATERAELEIFGARGSVLPTSLLETTARGDVQSVLTLLGLQAPTSEMLSALRLAQTPGVVAALPFTYRMH
jgi:protease-4